MLSHKQLPKMIIKNFKNNEKVFYYDIKKDIIGQCAPKKLGTEYNYYSDEIEKRLNKEVEYGFGMSVNSIKKALESNSSIIVDKEMVKSIIKYFDICTFRSNLAFDRVNKESYVIRFFDEQSQRNILIDRVLSTYNIKESRYENSKLIAVVNNTGANFITSRLSYYEISSNSTKVLMIPITPKLVIGLSPYEYNIENTILTIDNIDDIRYINTKAVDYEIEFNNDFVISNTREELEILRNYLKK